MTDLHWLGVVELARAIATRRLSPVELVQALLTQIEKLDRGFRSYVAVFADAALAAARSAEAAIQSGQTLGPLHGVPVALKDLFAVKGSPTTGGTRFLTKPAADDCTVVTRLRNAGAILLGKLNLHECAAGPEGFNPTYGMPWNPWHAAVSHLPGGSSSGSAVAVAAGLAPMGLGSDTGGSIRIPAACCGTVGLKPTYGRVSRQDVLPLAWSLDHVGPLTRKVEDAAAILAVIAGHDPADRTSSKAPVPDYLAGLDGPVREMRVGLVTEFVEQSGAEVQAAIADAVHVLQGLGCIVQEVTLPKAPHAHGASFAIVGAEALAFHEPLLRRHAAEYAVDVRRRFLAGRFLSATDYLKGQRARQLIRAEVDDVLQRVDCLLAPTLPIPAPPLTTAEVQIGGRTETTRVALTLFTRLFNVSGHPVVCLPCGFSREGLPLSMQLVGRAFEEADILRLGHAYQSATAWHRRRPPAVPD